MLPDYASYYLSQAADALDFLNANRRKIGGIVVGIQHGDVKPSNILLCGETVKLSDFGLSSTLSTSQARKRLSTPTRRGRRGPRSRRVRRLSCGRAG
jgi:serine/threonine protein kinase